MFTKSENMCFVCKAPLIANSPTIGPLGAIVFIGRDDESICSHCMSDFKNIKGINSIKSNCIVCGNAANLYLSREMGMYIDYCWKCFAQVASDRWVTAVGVYLELPI